jgi:predicted kinase
VVLVGGLPGAGKSTAIQRATAGRTDVDVIDSDTVRRWLRSRLPNGLPYGRFRWLVHTVTVIWMAVALVRGPRFGRRLVVHDPSTRPRRRRAFAGLARLRRWSPVLMLVDVSRAEALQGQRDRHRIVRPAAFDRHWTRWQQLRQLALARPTAIDDGRWSLVRLVDRADAAPTLAGLLVPQRRPGLVGHDRRPTAPTAADRKGSLPGSGSDRLDGVSDVPTPAPRRRSRACRCRPVAGRCRPG